LRNTPYVSCALIGLITAAAAVSWGVAGKLTAPVPGSAGAPPADLSAMEITLASASGASLSGWHIRVRESKGVVVLLHGLRGSRTSMLDRARWLHKEGYSSVLIDFRAHGESTGNIITGGYLEKEDVVSAVEFARRRHPSESIGVIGVSLGGASAVLGSPLDIDALVIESVYPDLRSAIQNRVVIKLGAMYWLPSQLLLASLQLRTGISPSSLRPIDQLAVVGCPILIASGAGDRRTTSAETQSMYQSAAPPKELWILENAAHVDLYRAAPEDYRRRVSSFLVKYM
jgi:fermentation-respiration switch protein FrsA (DUF1100 family)